MGLPHCVHAELTVDGPHICDLKTLPVGCTRGALLFDAHLMSSGILWGGAGISVKNESGYLPRFCGVYDAPGRHGLTADVSQTTEHDGGTLQFTVHHSSFMMIGTQYQA